MNVQLALKLTAFIDKYCDNVPHDIGPRVLEEIKEEVGYSVDYEVLVKPRKGEWEHMMEYPSTHIDKPFDRCVEEIKYDEEITPNKKRRAVEVITIRSTVFEN